MLLLILFTELWGLSTGDYTGFVISFLGVAFLFYLELHRSLVSFQSDLIDTLFKSSEKQNNCILELAMKLCEHIPKEEVIAILKKHGIEIAKDWDDFDKKWPKKPKNKEVRVPQWVNDFREKMKAATLPNLSPAFRRYD